MKLRYTAALSAIGRVSAVLAGLTVSCLDVSAQAADSIQLLPQLGHSAGVNCVAFSPDGTQLATAGTDHTILIWDVASGLVLRPLPGGHTEAVNQVAFSADGKTLASGGNDKRLIVWDITTGEKSRVVEGNSADIVGVAFSPRDHTLAFVDGHTVKTLDTQSATDPRQLDDNAGNGIAFSPDGKFLASAGTDGTVKVWDLEKDGSPPRLLRGNSSLITSLAFATADRHLLAAGTADGATLLWDTATDGAPMPVPGRSTRVTSLAFSPDGRTLATANGLPPEPPTPPPPPYSPGQDLLLQAPHVQQLFNILDRLETIRNGTYKGYNGISLIDVTSRKELGRLTGRDDDGVSSSVAFSSVAFSQNGILAAAATNETAIMLWSPSGLNSAGPRLPRLLAGATAVISVAVSRDGQRIAAGNDNRTITLWDATNGHIAKTLQGDAFSISKPTSLAFSPNGDTLAQAGDGGEINLWSIATGERRAFDLFLGPIRSIAFSPDGAIVACARGDAIELWDVASGKTIRPLTATRGKASSVSFSPAGRLLAAGYEDGSVILWDYASPNGNPRTPRGEAIPATDRQLPNPFAHPVTSLAFSQDGELLAAANQNGTVRLWNKLLTASDPRTLNSDFGALSSLTFSGSGHSLAAGTASGVVLFWADITRDGSPRLLRGHSGPINGVAFAHDVPLLASVSSDATTRVWSGETDGEHAALVSFGVQSFLAITPEGYFDSSNADAEVHLSVRVGNRVSNIGAYRDKFFRPQLVKRRLAGSSLPTAFAKTVPSTVGEAKPAPIVQFINLPKETASPQVAVAVRVTDAGGGIGEVRLFLTLDDGSDGAQKICALAQQPAPGASSVLCNISQTTSGVNSRVVCKLPPAIPATIECEFSLQVANGNNRLRAVALNKDSSQQSDKPAVGTITGKIQSHSRLHAVVIGIQEFQDQALNLTTPVADATSVREMLKSYSAGKPLFEDGLPADIQFLVTPDQTTNEALRNILLTMQTSVAAEDVFVFYVASHGEIVDGEYFLVTSNVAAFGADDLKRDALSGSELRRLLGSIPSTRKLMLLDTCHAAGIFDEKGMDPVTSARLLGADMETTMLASSAADQETKDSYRDAGHDTGHGLFAWVLGQALSGNGYVYNKTVTDGGLSSFVRDKVWDLSHQTQRPIFVQNGNTPPFGVTELK
jgi:WD40 repeat protein